MVNINSGPKKKKHKKVCYKNNPVTLQLVWWLLTFSMLIFSAITFIFCHLIFYMRRNSWHGSIRLWLIKLNTIKLIQLNLGVYGKISLLWSSKTKWKLMFQCYSLFNKTDFCSTLYLWSAYIYNLYKSKWNWSKNRQHWLPGKCHRQGSTEGNPISLA